MKPADYIDQSDAASEHATNTVLEILRFAKVKLGDSRVSITLLEPALPAAIKALYQAGFHRTSNLRPPGYHGRLTLRRFNIIVELWLPMTLFGADQYVAKLRKSSKLYITPMCLSDEGKIAKTKEDCLIDISYESALLKYEERKRLNDWRNLMQFVLPGNRQIVRFLRQWDRCLGLHDNGSAVDYDKFLVTWRMLPHGNHAWLEYIPSTDGYEIELKCGAFVWTREGNDFDYLETGSDFLSSLERHFQAQGGAAQCSSLSHIHEMMQRYEIPLDE